MLHTILAGSRTTRVNPTFVSESNARAVSTSVTVTAPSSIQDGDLLIGISFSIDAGLTVTPPSGFNLQYLDGSSANTLSIATKVASSESGDYTWTFSGVGQASGVSMVVYRNATRINTIGTIARATSATGTASSITPTYAGTLCVAFGSEASGPTVTTPPGGLTQRSLRTGSGNSPSFGIYDLSNQAASATSAYSIVWSGSGSVASIQFQVTNEPDVTPTFINSANTQNGATGSSLVINKPTNTADGDLMIAFLSSTGAVTWTGDTSWNAVIDQGAAPSLRIAHKTAGASEGASYTFTASSAATTLSGCILTYRYASYDTIAGAVVTAANPLILTSISPTLSQSILLAFGGRAAAAITLGTPTSMTARVTDSDATSPSYIVCSQTVAKGPVGTRSMSTGSTTSVAGILLSIKPTRSL